MRTALLRTPAFAAVLWLCIFSNVAFSQGMGPTAPQVLFDFQQGYSIRGIFAELASESFSSPPEAVDAAGGLSFDHFNTNGMLGYAKAGNTLTSQASYEIAASGTLIIQDNYGDTHTSVWIKGLPGNPYITTVDHSLRWGGYLEDGTRIELNASGASRALSTSEGHAGSESLELSQTTSGFGRITSDMLSREYFGDTYYRVPIFANDRSFVRDDTRIHTRVGETCTIFCSGPSTIRGTVSAQSVYTVEVGAMLCDDLVRNAVTVMTDPGTGSIRAEFTPNFGVTLQEAAEVCEVDHFNWRQEFTDHLTPPFRMEMWHDISYILNLSSRNFQPNVFIQDDAPHRIDDGTAIDATIIEGPAIDPIIDGSRNIYVLVVDGGLVFIPQQGSDPLEFYLDETGPGTLGLELIHHMTDRTLFFRDTPSLPDWALNQTNGDFMAFETHLVGVKNVGSFIDWSGIGTNFTWKSDRTHLDDMRNLISGEIFDVGYTYSLPEYVPLRASGEVFDIEIDTVPEPSGFLLVVAAVIMSFLLNRSNRNLKSSTLT